MPRSRQKTDVIKPTDRIPLRGYATQGPLNTRESTGLRAITGWPRGKQFDAQAWSLPTPIAESPLMHRRVQQATTTPNELRRSLHE